MTGLSDLNLTRLFLVLRRNLENDRNVKKTSQFYQKLYRNKIILKKTGMTGLSFRQITSTKQQKTMILKKDSLVKKIKSFFIF